MNQRAMTKTFFATLAALSLTACSVAVDAPPQEPPLAGSSIGGPFTLTSSDGEQVKYSDFEGQYRIVYFGYAYCPDVCPRDVQRLAQGYNLVKKTDPALAEQITPIFITIDPERDTQEVVGEFTSAFSPDIIGLTGTDEQIAAAAKAFAVYYTKGEVMANGGYLMDHSNIAYLMDKDGAPLAMLPVDLTPQDIADEIKKWTS